MIFKTVVHRCWVLPSANVRAFGSHSDARSGLIYLHISTQSHFLQDVPNVFNLGHMHFNYVSIVPHNSYYLVCSILHSVLRNVPFCLDHCILYQASHSAWIPQCVLNLKNKLLNKLLKFTCKVYYLRSCTCKL